MQGARERQEEGWARKGAEMEKTLPKNRSNSDCLRFREAAVVGRSLEVPELAFQRSEFKPKANILLSGCPGRDEVVS